MKYIFNPRSRSQIEILRLFPKVASRGHVSSVVGRSSVLSRCLFSIFFPSRTAHARKRCKQKVASMLWPRITPAGGASPHQVYLVSTYVCSTYATHGTAPVQPASTPSTKACTVTCRDVPHPIPSHLNRSVCSPEEMPSPRHGYALR